LACYFACYFACFRLIPTLSGDGERCDGPAKRSARDNSATRPLRARHTPLTRSSGHHACVAVHSFPFHLRSSRAGNTQHGDAGARAQLPKIEFRKSDANKIRTPDEFFARNDRRVRRLERGRFFRKYFATRSANRDGSAAAEMRTR
jgi:hypothetical protein